MRTRVGLTWALLSGILSLAGCQPLKIEKTMSVPVGGVSSLILDPPRYEQKVTVQISSPGAPVSAYLVRESDRAAAEALMQKDKAPTSPLAGKEKAEDITLEATVPAKTGFALLIRADKKNADVKVKVTGR
jgi:hypothetical protein